MTLEPGTNIYHAIHGLLCVVESNDYGQMFCSDEDDRFYLVDEDDETYSIVIDTEPTLEIEDFDDQEFAQSCISGAVAEKAMLILFDPEDNDEVEFRMLTKGVDLDLTYRALSTLREVVSRKIFSEQGLDN